MSKFTIITATAGAVIAGALAIGAPALAYAERGTGSGSTSSASDNDGPSPITDAQTRAVFNAIRNGDINSTRPVVGIDLP